MDQPLSHLSEIKTERLHIRPVRLADAEAFRAMTDEPAIIDAIHFLERPFTLVCAEKLIRSDQDGKNCFWGAWVQNESALLGTVGTHLRDGREIEIGYWFNSAAQGRGFASEAVRAVIRSLAHAYPKHLIAAECKPENRASWRLLEKVGFHANGTDGTRPGRKRFIYSG